MCIRDRYCPSAVNPKEYNRVNFLNRQTDDYFTFQLDGTILYQSKVANDKTEPAWETLDLELVKETFKIINGENGEQLLRQEQIQKMKQQLFEKSYGSNPKISLYGQDSLLNKYLIIDGQLETRTIGINFNKEYQKDFPFLLKTVTESEFGEHIIEGIKEVYEDEFDQQDLYFIDLAKEK